ncbi:hypothetical protein GGI05_006923, partial [Coemansia sp. RSA 2603]
MNQLPASAVFGENRLYTTSIHGLDNVVVPQPPPDSQPSRQIKAEEVTGKRLTVLRTRRGEKLAAKQAPPPLPRPWWMRLLVDAMVLPFIQGFMLNIGVHWVRNWRRSGGLL